MQRRNRLSGPGGGVLTTIHAIAGTEKGIYISAWKMMLQQAPEYGEEDEFVRSTADESPYPDLLAEYRKKGENA